MREKLSPSVQRASIDGVDGSEAHSSLGDEIGILRQRVEDLESERDELENKKSDNGILVSQLQSEVERLKAATNAFTENDFKILQADLKQSRADLDEANTKCRMLQDTLDQVPKSSTCTLQ